MFISLRIITSLLFVFILLSSCDRKKDNELLKLGKAPAFSFVNQNGETITEKDYDGKVYVVEFFFSTCPNICKIMNRNMVLVQKEFFNNLDFGIASFTVNPITDTPERLKEYSKELGVVDKNWNFLTGKKEDIYKLALNGYFVSAQEDVTAEGGFLHTEYFLLVDKEGNFRYRKDQNGNPIFYEGTDMNSVRKLKQDIKKLLKDG